MCARAVVNRCGFAFRLRLNVQAGACARISRAFALNGSDFFEEGLMYNRVVGSRV